MPPNGTRPSASRSTMSRVSEFDFKPHEKASTFLGLAKVAIMLVNVAFMIIGGMLIYFTVWIQRLGLVAMFQSNFTWLSGVTFGVVLAFGVLVVATSLVGCLGAWVRNRFPQNHPVAYKTQLFSYKRCTLPRHMMLAYIVVQTINLGVFVLVAIGGFLSLRLAHTLQTSATPTDAEAAFPLHFNPMYCQGQIAYYCTVGNVGESLTLFLGPAAAASARGVFDQLYGWDQACNSSLVRVTDPALSQHINAMCALCRQHPAAQYSEFLTSILDACPLTLASATWCAGFLNTPQSSSDGGNSPYVECRRHVLALWAYLSSWVGYGSLGVALCSLAIVGLTVLLRQLVVTAELLEMEDEPRTATMSALPDSTDMYHVVRSPVDV
ncbi:hypothetical protein, variant 1 [Aphanomyces astaci]|uniref:Tetraspanin n=1 Tax=Aphanomyces astaci TaxID=112090 RepID=W4H5Q7_APHAT|nr:hypothetical protein, variant 1 [Aphanomyces astaci]ETV87242.1 hypothetical protein, variant 1 [Aphanomyces astaci]|eukprot:XP_009824043.1 hypothetical protein, variant 1 [Aphanomyces astaci]